MIRLASLQLGSGGATACFNSATLQAAEALFTLIACRRALTAGGDARQLKLRPRQPTSRPAYHAVISAARADMPMRGWSRRAIDDAFPLRRASARSPIACTP